MLELNDYLDLTVATAGAQWRGLLQREYVSAGKKQEDFTPLETLLCFGLGLIGSQAKSGNINIPESSPAAIKLAELFKRSTGSLALKLANLDGRRAHRAKHEQQLWIRLTEDRFQFEVLYALILTAGRSVGLDAEKLPDFLGFEDNRLRLVTEADTVSDSELLVSVRGHRVTLPGSDEIDIRDTERALLGTARVGQQQFARKVLTNSGFACVFCGLSTRAAGLPSSRMLVASHIKPWSESAGEERVDPRNGLAACPTHDAAFEAHLFSVDTNGTIVRSPALDRAIANDASWQRNFGQNGLAPKLILPSFATTPSARYTDWHYSQFSVEFLY
ncbi:HNH endonuclease [Cryobacterium breve]|uniref:HNH endonuclease n=1 Tax=Cryobacterium breve TaxID=1259258 RepID=A0ABY7NGL3_9MICO|nr:HNH endonuclease [Cryobacterium breve]WBM80902.1 HNH endonuclease [Cryobacterium breve]